MDTTQAQRLTPTALAFVGDAVHTLYIRRRLVEKGHATGTLHITASAFCNAKAQADVFERLEAAGAFTEEEADIARRAKNAHLHSRTKTASSADYHKATALEAVIGWLEITGNTSRRDELLDRIAALSLEEKYS